MLTNVTTTCRVTVSHQISGSVANLITALAEIVKHTVVAQLVSGNVVFYNPEKRKGEERRKEVQEKRESM